jgi:hypothetical protein
MTTVFSAFPAEGTEQYAELVRRQTAVGIPDVPTCERERLFREGIGSHWVRDRQPSTPRPRRSTAARPVAPAITITAVAALPTPRPRHVTPPVRKRWWQFWR